MLDIIKFVSEYGILPVLIGVLLYILLRMSIKASKRKDKAEEEAAKEAEKKNEAEREAARRQQDIERDEKLFKMVKELIQPPHTVEEQNKDLKRNTFINQQLECLVNEGADRAYMFMFHNGGVDVLGRGFLKMSMSLEVIGENMTPIMSKYLNMPRMLFPVLYNELNKQDFYNVDDIEEIKKKDPFTYQFLKEHGAHTAMFRAIKRADGLVIGFIGMEYISKDCEDFKKAGKNIDKKVNRIMGALLGQDN